MKKLAVLVCGGRDFDDYEFVRKTLSAYNIGTIIEGGARGADACGYRYARHNKEDIELKTFEADWDTHKKAAGFIRNQQMLTEGNPDLVIAFPGGNGTADMIRRAKRAGVEVIEPKIKPKKAKGKKK